MKGVKKMTQNIIMHLVTGRVLRLTAGIIQLTREQAKTRLHNLNPLKEEKTKGIYSIVKPVEFIRGETIGIDIKTIENIPVQIVAPKETIEKAIETEVEKVSNEKKLKAKKTKEPADDDPTVNGALS